MNSLNCFAPPRAFVHQDEPSSTSPDLVCPSLHADTVARQRVNGYELGAEICKAALRPVTLRLGRRLRDGLGVCVKVVSKPQLTPTMSAMLASEMRILDAMRHDAACVHMLESFEDRDNVYIVMDDFVTDYTDLPTMLASKTRLPEPQALHVLMQLTHFLARLHGNGIAHRDLKLPHIALHNRTHAIMVTDFSLGSILVPATKGYVHDQRGSPAYISPEVLSGRPYNAMRSDLWSVGVILYKLLTGRFPFNDTSHTLLFQKIKVGQFAVPPEELCSHDTLRLLRHLLHMNPAERPTADMLHPVLRSILAQHVANASHCGMGATPARGPGSDEDWDQAVPSI